MSHTARLRRSPKNFRQLTGITLAAFDRLLAELTPRYEQAEARRKDRPGRKRRPGAGRINALQPLLAGIFRIPERRISLDPEDIREVFFDATERPRRRPKRGQREYDSGKKKRHTIKTQVAVVRRSKPPGPGPKPRRVRIAAVGESAPGSVRDKKVYDGSRVVVPRDAKRTGDTAYLGTGLKTPTRKPKGGELTEAQKSENRKLSRRRVAAEHGIGKMKVWRIASERYRNPHRRHTLIMKNVAGLHNMMYA